MSVRTGKLVKEVPVTWEPKGGSNSIIATVRNGDISLKTSYGINVLACDLSGAMEFLRAIEEAVLFTKLP